MYFTRCRSAPCRSYNLARVALLFLVLLVAKTSRGADPERRFRDEYPAAAAKLRADVLNLVCKGSGQHGKKVTFRAKCIFLGQSAIAIFHYPEDLQANLGAGKVNCWTPDLTFTLMQLLPDGPYAITSIANDPASLERAKLTIGLDAENFAFAAFQLYDTAVADLLADPGFVITRATELSEGGTDLVRIEFDLTQSRSWYQSGHMTLIPSLEWAVRDYELLYRSDHGERATEAGVIHCKRWPSGIVFPTTVSITSRTEDKGETTAGEPWEMRFDAVDLNTVTAEQFSLSAFNVPDVVLEARRSSYPFNRWLFWTLCALALATSLLLWRRYRRDRDGVRQHAA